MRLTDLKFASGLKRLAPVLALALSLAATPAMAQPIANPIATFAGLDKITGRITRFDVYIDETVLFGALEITPRACYTHPPTEVQRTSRLPRSRSAEPAGLDQAHLYRLDVCR